jgi:uncharacterized protein (TIGR02147 family)
MKEQLAFQKILLGKYEEARSKNAHYSRRAFSKKLGISAGAISELLSGQRKVSLKLAEKIIGRLELDPQERVELLELFPRGMKAPKSAGADKSKYLQISADQFRVIGDWYHFAILTLMRSSTFKSNPDWIGQRFGIGSSIVVSALERLKRLGFIKEADKKLILAESLYRTSDDIANISVKRAHFQYLDKAREALETLAVEERDFTSLMLTMHPSQLPRAKELIRKFQDELMAELEDKPQPEVYQLCIQMFPLTKNKKT